MSSGNGARSSTKRASVSGLELPRLDEIVCAADERNGLLRHTCARRELAVVERAEHVRRQRADAIEVEPDVVTGEPELLQVRANRLGWIAAVAQCGDRRAGGTLRKLSSVVADDEPV